MSDNPRVFISYSHQNAEYEKKVLSFANKLRSEGIDATIDLYEESPPEGWPRWMENQIREAEFVLVISSKSYYDKCYSKNKGNGISWEVNIVYQHIYEANSENKKFIPVCFNENDIQYILTPLKSFTYYNVETNEGYERLYWRLRGITQTYKPPLGKLKPLPEKERKTMFFSSPIDLGKWTTAGWKGMLYLFPLKGCPILGLVFKDYETAKSIFLSWKKEAGNSYADKFLKIDFIVPPFPKGCWVYYDKNRNYGKGYFVHIGPNVDESVTRAIESGIQLEELILASISRYLWMDQLEGSQYRDMFKNYVNNGSDYMLMPIGIRDEAKPIVETNLIIDFSYAVKMKRATFQTGIDIKDDNICKVVFRKT